MAQTKLTKAVAHADKSEAKEYELRDTIVPGFLLKVTRAGPKIFMLQYRTNAGSGSKSECRALVSPNARNTLNQPLDRHGARLATFDERAA
jgi:hypothetical protein